MSVPVYVVTGLEMAADAVQFTDKDSGLFVLERSPRPGNIGTDEAKEGYSSTLDAEKLGQRLCWHQVPKLDLFERPGFFVMETQRIRFSRTLSISLYLCCMVFRPPRMSPSGGRASTIA